MADQVDLSNFVDPWAAGAPTTTNQAAGVAPTKDFVDPWGNQGGLQPGSAPQLPRSLALPSVYGDAAQPAAQARAGYSVTSLPRDLGVAALKGVNTFARGAYELGNLATGGGLDTVTDTLTGEPMSSRFQRTEQIESGWQSPEMQAKQQFLAQQRDKGFFTGAKTMVTDPALMASSLAESWTYLLGLSGAVKYAAEKAFAGAAETALAKATAQGMDAAAAQQLAQQAGTAAARKVGSLAAVGANGVLMGSQSASSVRGQVLAMSTAEAEKSPDYQRYRADGLTPSDAKAKLANKAATTAAAISGSIGALSTAVSGAGPLEAEVFAKKLFGGELTDKARNLIAQGAYNVGKMTVENAALGGGSQIAENVGMGFADPSIAPMQGVGQAAGSGAAVGAVMGAGMEGFRQMGAKPAPAKSPEGEQQPSSEDTAGAPPSAPTNQVPAAPESVTQPQAAGLQPPQTDAEPLPASMLLGEEPPENESATIPAITPESATAAPAGQDQAAQASDLEGKGTGPQARPAKASKPAPAPKAPLDILAAIAMNGGLNRDQAKSEFGLDPAQFNTLGHGIKRVFTKNGLNYDYMAQHLAELGYPVVDEKGDYSPDLLHDAVERALAGHKIYRAADLAVVADREYAQRLEDHEAQHGDEHPVFGTLSDLTEEHDAPPEVGDLAALMAHARQTLGDDGFEALHERLAMAGEHLSDADYNALVRRELENATNAPQTHTPDDRSGQPAQGSGSPGSGGDQTAVHPQDQSAQHRTGEAGQPQGQVAGDLFGGKSDTQQAIHDYNVERQRQHQASPPMESGEGGLFNGAQAQADIEDVIARQHQQWPAAVPAETPVAPRRRIRSAADVRKTAIPDSVKNPPERFESADHAVRAADDALARKTINKEFRVPYLGGVSNDGRTIYFDKRMPHSITVDGVPIDLHRAIGYHESVEYPRMHGPVDDLSYPGAHQQATGAERAYVEAHAPEGVDKGEFFDHYQREVKKLADAARESKDGNLPPDLDPKPYVDSGEEHLLRGAPKAEATPAPRQKNKIYKDKTPKPEQESAATLAEKPEVKKPSTDYGTKNTVFTADAAAKARELLKKKLGDLNAGIDPELMQAGITLAGYHVEAGARKFADFAHAMLADLGEAVKPYLKSWYNAIRDWPGFDAKGMDDHTTVDDAVKGGFSALTEHASEVDAAAHEAQQAAISKHGLPEKTDFHYGKGLAKNKIAASVDGVESNYHESADAAAKELSKFLSDRSESDANTAKVKEGQKAIADKLRGGNNPTFAEWKAAFPQLKMGHTYLRQPDVSPFLVEYFGFKPNSIKARLGDAAGTVTSDTGAKYPIVYFNKLADVLGNNPEDTAHAEAVRGDQEKLHQEPQGEGQEGGAGVQEPGGRNVQQPAPEQPDESGASGGAQETAPVKPSRGIEDFGETIEGARKHYAQAYRDKMRDAEEIDVAAEPLSKSWPEPDYAKLIETGANPWMVAFIHAARDTIPTKPQARWKLSGWADRVKLFREFANHALDGQYTPEAVREKLASEEFKRLNNDLSGRIDLYQAIGHDKSLKGVRIAAGQYSVFRGKEIDPPRVIWTVEKKAAATALSNWPEIMAEGDTREEAIANFKKRVESGNALADEPASKQVSFDIYTYRAGDKKGKYYIGKKIGKEQIDLESFDDVKAAREYLANHRETLVEKWNRLRDVPNERRDTNAPRVGVDHRNGADVTPEQFSDAFGFRGVQFGNYVEGARRGHDLNDAYDALVDLAGILDVPPKALSLNGELGLAFGARGTGGKGAAKAHYERDHVVINLTKNKGAGSLAHEWWHALDNYFSRLRQDKYGYLTESAYPRGEGVRPEMVDAFRKVAQTVTAAAVQERAKRLDQMRTKPYWSTGREMTARSFESYVIEKLRDQGAANDYLANIVSKDYWDAAAALGLEKGGTYPYPEAAEMPAIRGAFDDFFRAVETKETDKGVAMFSRKRGWANFPDAIIAQRTAQDHPDYQSAKSGDIKAAMRLARDKVTPEYVDKVRSALGEAKPIVLPVRSAEKEGAANAIPVAAAETLAARLGLKVDDNDVRQQERIGRGGADGMYRLANQPTFAGKVEKSDYLLVDDTLTQGGTMAQLKDYIEDHGGRVILATTLTGKQYSAKIALSDTLLKQVRHVYGSIEPWWRDTFGYGFEGLTESEARYLFKSGLSPDALRERIAGARLSGDARRGTTDDQGRFSRPEINGADLQNPTPEPRPSAGVSASDMERTLRPLVDKLPVSIPVEYHQSYEDAPPDLYRHIQDAGADIEGAAYKGTVHLFGDQIRDMDRAKTVLLKHEFQHIALRRLLGSDMTKVLNAAWVSKEQGKIRDFADQMGIRYNTANGRLEAAEEYIVHLAETDQKNGLVQRTYAVMRDWLRRMGWNLKLNDVDLRELVASAGKYLNRGTREIPEGTVAFSRRLADQDVVESVAAPVLARRIFKGFRSVNDFVVPETQEFDGNMTGDLMRVPDAAAHDGIKALPVRLPVGVARGQHAGFGLEHLADNARRDQRRVPPQVTDDQAENQARQVVTILRSTRQIYQDPTARDDRVIFHAPGMKLAVVAEPRERDGERYYSVISVVPAQTAKWGRSAWSGRLTFPESSRSNSEPPRPSTSQTTDDATTGPQRAGVQTERYQFSTDKPAVQVRVKNRIKKTDGGPGPGSGEPPRFSRGPVDPEQQKQDGLLEKLSRPIKDALERRYGANQLGQKPDWVKKMPPAMQEALRKSGVWVQQKSLKERYREAKQDAGLKILQGTLDQFAPVLQRIGEYPYQLLRMSSSYDAGLEAALHKGQLRITDKGALSIKPGTKGLLEILKPLHGEVDRFLSWVAGNRAEALTAEDREHLFGDADIGQLKSLSGKLHDKDDFRNGLDGNQRAAVYTAVLRDYNAFSKSILDIAEKNGIIDGESRTKWEREFYVPFFREQDDGKVNAPGNLSGMVNQYAFKKLKGGENVLHDLLANTIQNWSHLLSASLKNRAAAVTLDQAEKIGAAHQVSVAEKGSVYVLGEKEIKIPKGQKYLDNGVEKVSDGTDTMTVHGQIHYMVDDPLVSDSITALEQTPFRGRAMRFFGAAKHILTVGTTMSPVFRLRHTIREQITALAANPTTYHFVKNWLDGFKYSSRDNPVYYNMLAGGSFFRMGYNLEGDRAAYVKQLLKHGIDEKTVLDNPERVKQALKDGWDWWKETGERSDSITRANLYRQTFERLTAAGKSADDAHFEAAYVARDAMDYGLHGTWPAIRMITQVVPFMNARMQGLYKLGRGAVNDPQRFAKVVGGITLATMALTLAYRNDPDFQKREEWDRDNNWWFKIGDKAFRVPKPFELGALGTIADRALETVLNGFDPASRERFISRLVPIIGSQLNINPVPQLLFPAAEIWANKDLFTGRAIESQRDEKLTVDQRIGPHTSATAQLLGKAGILSPEQIDFLVNAYLGWVGTHAVATADLALRPVMGLPSKPTPRIDDYFLVGDFVKDLPSNQSRFIEQFYTHLKDVQQAVGSMRQMQMNGQTEKVQEEMRNPSTDIRMYSTYTEASRAMTQINARIHQIIAARMDTDQKRQQLDQLYQQRAGIAKQVEDMRAKELAR